MRKFLKTTLLCGCISASLLLQVSCGRAGQETTQGTAEVQTDAQTEAREKIVQKESAVQLLPGATGIDESKYDFDSVTMDDTVIVLDPSRQECAISAEEEAIGPGASEEKHKYTKNGQGAYSGQSEADLCLQVAKKARDELQDKGYKVFLTREDNDTLLSNTERSQIANKYKADVFVRINANSDKNGEKNGSFCIIPSEDNPYVSSMYGECRRLAESLIGTYCEETGMANGGCMERDDNIGINWSNMPVTVLELGYLTNQSDDYKMEKENFRDQMAEGLAKGIAKYLEGDSDSKESSASPETEAALDYYEIYDGVLVNTRADAGLDTTYALYDIDGDGIKEMITSQGTCNADWYNVVYTTSRNGEVSMIGKFYRNVSLYVAEDGNGIYTLYGIQGYQEVNRITKSGNSISEDLISTKELQPGEEYDELEHPIEWISCSDEDYLRTQ